MNPRARPLPPEAVRALDDLLIPNGALIACEGGLGFVIVDDPLCRNVITWFCNDPVGFVVTSIVYADFTMSFVITENHIGWAEVSPGLVVREALP